MNVKDSFTFMISSIRYGIHLQSVHADSVEERRRFIFIIL